MVWLRVCRRGALPDGGAAGVKAVELPEGVKGWADGRLASFLANTAGVAEPCRVSVRYADGEEDEIQQTRAGWRILKTLEDDDVVLVEAAGAAATIADYGGGDVGEDLGLELPPGEQNSKRLNLLFLSGSHELMTAFQQVGFGMGHACTPPLRDVHPAWLLQLH